MMGQKKTDSLTEAFDITKGDQIIAFAGAGGKTQNVLDRVVYEISF